MTVPCCGCVNVVRRLRCTRLGDRRCADVEGREELRQDILPRSISRGEQLVVQSERRVKCVGPIRAVAPVAAAARAARRRAGGAGAPARRRTRLRPRPPAGAHAMAGAGGVRSRARRGAPPGLSIFSSE